MPLISKPTPLGEYVANDSALEQPRFIAKEAPSPSSTLESSDKSVFSAPSSISELPEPLKDNRRAKLANLVAKQLETTVALSPEAYFLLPVSIDCRLCPEVNILDRPMTDVYDALKWVETSCRK